MIAKQTLNFLKDLKANNNKEWFDANRLRYEYAKENMKEVTQELIKAIGSFDPDIAKLEAKQCMFRINRYIRFSANKEPYKSNLGASFNKDGKKAHGGGYYFHVQPGGSFLAGGIWMPEADVLKKIRQEIDYNTLAFKKIIYNKDFVKHFKELSKEDSLANVPKGYPKDHPEAELLKLKSYIVSTDISDKELTSADFIAKAKEMYKAMKPLISFVNTAIE